MTHARHRTMLNVVLGESLEHQRLFDAGRRAASRICSASGPAAALRVGGVLPARWQE